MKIGKLFIGDLCCGCCYVPQRKEIAPIVAAALISGAAAIGSGIIGANASASASNKAEARQRRQEAKEEAWYKRMMNQDYASTAAGQNLMRRAREVAQEQWKRAAGSQAVAGGTAAATQMAKDSGNKMVADTVANMAAIDTQRQDRAAQSYTEAQRAYMQADMNRYNQQAANTSQAASGLSNAIGGLANAFILNGQGNGGTSV